MNADKMFKAALAVAVIGVLHVYCGFLFAAARPVFAGVVLIVAGIFSALAIHEKNGGRR